MEIIYIYAITLGGIFLSLVFTRAFYYLPALKNYPHIAGLYDLNIYILSSNRSDYGLSKPFSRILPRSIVFLEDMNVADLNQKNTFGGTLSNFLDVIDEDGFQKGHILIISPNHIHHLDGVFSPPGRIDEDIVTQIFRAIFKETPIGLQTEKEVNDRAVEKLTEESQNRSSQDLITPPSLVSEKVIHETNQQDNQTNGISLNSEEDRERHKSSKSTAEMIVVRQSESPWDTFTKIYDCDLAGPLAVVAHRARPSQLFGVRTIRHKDIDQLLHLFESLQHPNVLSALEAYVYDKSLYIFHSDICISLDEIITCDADLDEIQLAAILAQILDGLLYLTERNTQHPCLSSQNILCTSEGEVKIARLEECKEVQADKIGQYSKELEVITMELMQVYKKGGSNAELDNTERWDGSDALEFLLSVVSEAPIQKLREHPLFTNNQWLKGHLQGLVSYASRFAFTFCDYADA